MRVEEEGVWTARFGGVKHRIMRIMSVKEWSWRASTVWFMLVIAAFGE